MAGMDALERTGEPPAALRTKPWQHGLEITLVAVTVRMASLEQEDDLWPSVWNPVFGPLDHLVVRQTDRLVTAADPGAACGGLAEDVESPEFRLWFAHPRLMRLREAVSGFREWRRLVRAGDDEELEVGEDIDDLVEAGVGKRDLEILVLAAITAQKEVDRPPGGDVPRRLDSF